MVITFIIVTTLYFILIASFVYGFNKLTLFKTGDGIPKTSFSIVIPFRNEAKSLPLLLQSILELNYPENLLEVILVDDASEDASVDIIMRFLANVQNDININIIKNIRTSHSPKKDAITSAIQKAKNNWIVTTDADCILPSLWLKTFDAFIQKNDPKMIVAPVSYIAKNNFLDGFQLLDFWSLQAATIGAFGIGKPFMSNGANLAYKKSVFNELDGFEGNNSIASGDDLFLMEKLLLLDSKSVQYIKSKKSIVFTKSQQSWPLLFQQRIRWAAKASAYKNGFSKLIGFIVLMMNSLLIIFLTLVIIKEFNSYYFLFGFLLKGIIDYIAINKFAVFLNKKIVFKQYLLSTLLYPFFSVSVVAYSLFFKYKWKGRSFKQ